MRSRRPGAALLASFILGLSSLYGYGGGGLSHPDTVGLALTAYPSTAGPGAATQGRGLSFGKGCSLAQLSATLPSASVEPLAATQAHNDYHQCRPVYDALDSGFTSIEADVWLMDGRLLVGHDRSEATAGRSLERLYLSPLEGRVRMNARPYTSDGRGPSNS
jgi:hypothetical protein